LKNTIVSSEPPESGLSRLWAYGHCRHNRFRQTGARRDISSNAVQKQQPCLLSPLLKSQKEKRHNEEGGLQAGIRKGGWSTAGISQVRLSVQRGIWLKSER